MKTDGSDGDLVMESTTDTPAQIAEGMGIPVAEVTSGIEPPADAAPVQTAADLAAQLEAVTGTKSPTSEAVVTPPPVKAGPVASATPKIETSDAEPDLAAVHAAVTSVSEKLDRFAAPPAKEPAVTEPPVAELDPRVTAHFDAARTALGAKPKQEDFEDFAEFETTRDEWIENRAVIKTEERAAHASVRAAKAQAIAQAQSDAQSRINAFISAEQQVKTRYADFDQVMQKAATLRVHPEVQRAIADSPHGAEIKYRLAKDPTKLDYLAQSTSVKDLDRRIGRLEAEIDADGASPNVTAPAGATATGPSTAAPPVTVRRTTRAPAPTGTQFGAGPSAPGKTPLEEEPTQAEYNARRARERRAKGLSPN